MQMGTFCKYWTTEVFNLKNYFPPMEEVFVFQENETYNLRGDNHVA